MGFIIKAIQFVTSLEIVFLSIFYTKVVNLISGIYELYLTRCDVEAISFVRRLKKIFKIFCENTF